MRERFAPLDLLLRQPEPVRFAVTGLGNTAFNYVLFAILLWVFHALLVPMAGEVSTAVGWAEYTTRTLGNKYYLVTQIVAWLITIPVSTYTMKHIAFKKNGPFLPQMLRSFGVYLPAQTLELATIWLVVEAAGYHPLIGKLGAVVTAAVVSYIGHKYFTFGGSEPSGQERTS